jgi:hypothetical protein
LGAHVDVTSASNVSVGEDVIQVASEVEAEAL